MTFLLFKLKKIDNNMKKKICLVASCGGHIMELLQLVPAVEGADFYIVTEKNPAAESLLTSYRHYYLYQQQRKGWTFPFVFVSNIILSLYYLLKESPSIIISTGAGASYPTCRLGKLFKKKIIYIESFAKLNSSSLTGRLVYPFADYFFVQWEEMKKVYPKAICHGTVY